MSKMNKIREFAKQNPKVDEAQAKKAIEAIGELRRHGVPMKGYSLKNPFRVRTGTFPTSRLSGRAKIKNYA
jgi:hypothetical protein